MKKRVARKILKNKDKLNYPPNKIATAEKKSKKMEKKETTA